MDAEHHGRLATLFHLTDQGRRPPRGGRRPHLPALGAGLGRPLADAHLQLPGARTGVARRPPPRADLARVRLHRHRDVGVPVGPRGAAAGRARQAPRGRRRRGVHRHARGPGRRPGGPGLRPVRAARRPRGVPRRRPARGRPGGRGGRVPRPRRARPLLAQEPVPRPGPARRAAAQRLARRTRRPGVPRPLPRARGAGVGVVGAGLRRGRPRGRRPVPPLQPRTRPGVGPGPRGGPGRHLRQHPCRLPGRWRRGRRSLRGPQEHAQRGWKRTSSSACTPASWSSRTTGCRTSTGG